jgi:DNA-binding response OmpR family regulator
MGSAARKRVLMVEDEMLVALLLEDYLMELGFDVIGPAMRLEEAMELAGANDIDFAILDINLAGKQSFPVADVLKERGIPFMFASGYGASGLIERFAGACVIRKPFDAQDVQRGMQTVLDRFMPVQDQKRTPTE